MASCRAPQWERMESRVVANTERLLDLFDEFGVRSTFFVLGWVAERHPDLVRTHCATRPRGGLARLRAPAHLRPDAGGVSRRRPAREAAARGCSRPPRGRLPRAELLDHAASLWALDVLIEEGYEYDSSIFPIRHDRYGIPVSERQSLSHRTRRRSARRGAGVDDAGRPAESAGRRRRLFPDPAVWWTRWGIARVNRLEQRPAIFYLHPWEIDPDQPRLPAGRLGRFRHYRNLEDTETRLRRLLTDFRFDTIETVVAQVRHALSPTRRRMPLPYAW